MNSTLRFILIALLVGLLFGGAYFFLGSTKKDGSFGEGDGITSRLPASDAVARVGDAVAKSVGKRLLEALTAKISSDGAAASIGFCREAAPVLTAQAATEFEEQGVAFVKRMGVRVRSPGNTPSERERVLLGEMMEEIRRTGQATPRVVLDTASADRVSGVYYRPILTDGLCMTCHGPKESIAPDIRAAITAAYPGDEAVDFKAGDLRGVFAVGFESLPEGFPR